MSREQYLDRPLNFSQRSALSRFRSGTFPLSIELGRYRRPVIPAADRVCRICNDRSVEDETHFLVRCPAYTNLRQQHFTPEQLRTGGSDTDQMVSLMTVAEPKHLANYIIQAYEHRGSLLNMP